MKPIKIKNSGNWRLIADKQGSNITNHYGSYFGINSTTKAHVRDNEFFDIQRSKTEVSGKSNAVLVMDDEVAVREVITKILVLNKFNVQSVSEGAEAVYLYKKAKSCDKCYDAVILDLSVPGGMGGGEAMQHLKRIDPNVKGILSSGYSADPIVANFKDYGFSAMLPKPFKINDLISIVNQVTS